MPYEPADAKTNDSVGPLPSQGTSSASSQVATGTARGNRHHHHRMSVVEAQQAQLLVNKIISNFQERIQIRRSLVELEEMDALNRNELEQNKLVVAPHLDNMDQVGLVCQIEGNKTRYFYLLAVMSRRRVTYRQPTRPSPS